MITATLRISVSNTKKEEAIRLLRSLVGPTRVETGCISCHLYQEVSDPDVVTWVEQWRTQDDLECHLRSPQYKRILAALDMSDVEPEINFDTVIETKGMHLIEEARGVDTSN
jgi:quinol monooxygenase YgiN